MKNRKQKAITLDEAIGLGEYNPKFLERFEEFKKLSGDCKAVMRSGECTPYANIILYAGVTF